VLRHQIGEQYARAVIALARDQTEKLDQVIEEMRAGEISPEIAKIEIDARKWFASKLDKRTWGDKVAVEQSGSVTLNRGVDTSLLTDDQLAALASIPMADQK
jgi:hypothetical protein